ncbi:uncharacterized protein LOC126812587 [Patella vulgata]|uniref:uncharacterized protein LOC126812587 n=1 Tax=Patella vulgata TaxID=6465 RepID=UPI00217FCF87|nr:uncharacterized protein LOC126812587 [Patella vulgata]
MQNELSKATKLTYNHVHLTSFSVMKVNLAAQVLSRSVGLVIEEYGGEAATETAKFIKLVDRFFDCLNVRSLYEGERKRKPDLMPYTSVDDPRFQFLTEDFLGYLRDLKDQVDNRQGFSKTEKSKMFLSYQSKAVVEATKYLIQHGVKFVLTNKFCQDPVEEHFGRHRALGRRSDNPTVFEFGYQENKLRLQRSLALQIKPNGNVKRSSKQYEIEIDDTPLKKKRRNKTSTEAC